MTISRFLSFTWEGFGEGGEAKMKGIFMEVLKCFGFRKKCELPVPFLEINGSSVRRRITEKGFYWHFMPL